MILSYDAGGTLVYIEFDATVREEHQSSTTVTEYHVETGANVADHARPENDRVTVDVVVTNTPITPPRTNAQGKRGGFRPVSVMIPTITSIPKILPGVGLLASLIPQGTEIVRFQALDFDGEFDRIRSVYDDLYGLIAETTLVNLFSPVRSYTNMVLRTLTTPRGPNDGSSITFTFTATQVRFVDSEVVTVTATSRKKSTKGVKPAKATDPKDKQSVADRALNGKAAPGSSSSKDTFSSDQDFNP